MAQLLGELEKFKQEFEMRSGQSLDAIPGMERPPQSVNVSDTVSKVIWAKQLQQKVLSNLKIAQSLFQDMKSLEKYP